MTVVRHTRLCRGHSENVKLEDRSGRIEVTGRRGRRRKKLLDDLKERRG